MFISSVGPWRCVVGRRGFMKERPFTGIANQSEQERSSRRPAGPFITVPLLISPEGVLFEFFLSLVWRNTIFDSTARRRSVACMQHIREIAWHLSRSSTWNLFWRKLALSSPIAAFPAKHLFGQSRWKLDRV